ncbi:MAG: hypothetical protein ABSF87_17585 [Xanthobacteraceae bacterium]|jgi:hypothetical protein
MSNGKNLKTYSTEIANIDDAARQDASFDKSLKYKKGDYLIDDSIPVAHGTKFLTHPEAWTKVWSKFDKDDESGNWKLLEKKHYRVARGEKAPEREDLDEWPDQTNWPKDDDGEPTDPWVLFYLIPFEILDSGELIIFQTRSGGGRRAVADLAKEWTRHAIKNGGGQPIVALGETTFPSKKYGKVRRPLFTVVDWDDAAVSNASPVNDVPPDEELPAADDGDFDDRVPF